MNGERSTLPLPGEGAANLGAGQPAPFSADDRLEVAIEATRQALLAAVSPAVKRELAEQMKRLIGQRSPERVAHMELERGLR